MAALGYSASRESALGAPANIGALSSTSRTRTRRPVRRGELCGLQIRDVGLDRALVHVAFNYVVRGGRRVRKDTKTHQDRWLAIDPVTLRLS